MKLIWVTDAKYANDYKLLLTFSDGCSGLVDLCEYVTRQPFAPLKDVAIFRDFTLNDWTISWLNGRLDIAPETLYQKLQSA